MPKLQPGALVSVRDDLSSSCFIVTSDELLVPKTVFLDPCQDGLAWALAKKGYGTTSKEYRLCEIEEINTSYPKGTSEFVRTRTPVLPNLAMFLTKLRVKFVSKARMHHAALILGERRRYIVPLHFLGPAKPRNLSG